MALTEEERRLLEEIEQTFKAEDPGLATKFSKAPRKVQPAKAGLAALGVIVGLIVLVVGMSVHWLVSVAGFVIMLISAIILVSAWAPSNPSSPSTASVGKSPAPSGPDFMTRVEERWKDRQQG